MKILKFILLPFSLSYFKSISYFLTFLPAGSCSFWAFIWPEEERQASSCLALDASPVPSLETECLISILQAASNGPILKSIVTLRSTGWGPLSFFSMGIKKNVFFFFFLLGIKTLMKKENNNNIQFANQVTKEKKNAPAL